MSVRDAKGVSNASKRARSTGARPEAEDVLSLGLIATSNTMARTEAEGVKERFRLRHSMGYECAPPSRQRTCQRSVGARRQM